MKPSAYYFIALFACIDCVQAQNAVTAETVKPVIEAADKPFTEFALALRSTRLPGLPLPTSMSADRHLLSVSQLLWRQLSDVNTVASVANKASVLSSLEAMCGIHSWLLDGRSYANLLFAARIEETVCLSTLSALADSKITIDEALSLLQHLGRPIQLREIVEVIEVAVPNSKAVAQVKKNGMESSILDLSNLLAEESPELIDGRITTLIESERLASIVFYITLTSTTRHFSDALVEFASKGGQLNRPQDDLIEQIKVLMPEVIGKTNQSTGIKVNAAMLAALMDNVRKWKAKQQQTKP